jgi:nuclear transport factor 2 (NTF2) superfamily protein
LGYTPDSWWRNRSTFVQGREQIVEFLTTKWKRNSTTASSRRSGPRVDRIAVRFA